MKKYLKLIIFICFLLLFLLLGYFILKGNDICIDKIIYNKIKLIINEKNTNIMKCMTYLGSAYVVIGITIFSLIVLRNKKYSLFMSINLIIITLLQILLKNIYSRTRPVNINLIEETGYSFPSGHSLTAMAFYGLIIYFIFISNINNISKYFLIILFSIIIILIGISRIYLGVHYTTDVIGAVTFSLSYLIVYTSIIKRWIK